MKNFKNIAAALAVIVILFSGCKNPADDVKIVVDTDIFKSPILLQFINAKDGAEGPQNFNVEITGPNASLVRTATGGKSFKAAAGLLNLLLDRTANPSPTSPVKFTVVANAPGFAPTYQDVVVTSATDPIILRVAMSQYTNPAANTGSVVSTKGTVNGTTASEIVFTTNTNAAMAQKSDITVPSGTSLLDGAGQPVGGDQVEARIVHYSAAGASSLPGASYASNVIGANGQPITNGVNFDIAGAVSIDMFYGSKEVKGFSKPVNVDIEVSSTMINPNTNQPIKENETIPMWSLNDQTGQWKSEGDATFVKNAAGNLVARMQITHLSGWAVAFARLFCTTTSTVIINRPAANESGVFVISYGGIKLPAILAKGELTKTVTLPLVPNKAGTISVQAFNGTYINNTLSTSYASLCSVNSTFTFVAPQDIIKVDVDIKFKCTDRDLVTGVNSIVTVTEVGKPASSGMAYNLVKGMGSGFAVNGATYKVVASVDGTVYTTQFTVEKKSSTLPAGDLSGTVVYNAATNTLKIEGSASKNCN
ncbi:MAG: hypothetical protein V4663_02900 [Bacteroidota bacterium]